MLYNILKSKGKETSAVKTGVLTGNQLKIVALITMTIDHIGKLIFPQYRVLRVIGRLAFPIFAFMIAEGCKYTKSSKSYLASIVTLAAVCQITLCVAEKSLHQNILVTFTLSIILILSIRKARESKAVADVLASFSAAAVFLQQSKRKAENEKPLLYLLSRPPRGNLRSVGAVFRQVKKASEGLFPPRLRCYRLFGSLHHGESSNLIK